MNCPPKDRVEGIGSSDCMFYLLCGQNEPTYKVYFLAYRNVNMVCFYSHYNNSTPYYSMLHSVYPIWYNGYKILSSYSSRCHRINWESIVFTQIQDKSLPPFNMGGEGKWQRGLASGGQAWWEPSSGAGASRTSARHVAEGRVWKGKREGRRQGMRAKGREQTTWFSPCLSPAAACLPATVFPAAAVGVGGTNLRWSFNS